MGVKISNLPAITALSLEDVFPVNDDSELTAGNKTKKATIAQLVTLVESEVGSTVFLGVYADLSALETAHPTADEGQYAQVDAGSGSDVVTYYWDADEGWVQGGSITAPLFLGWFSSLGGLEGTYPVAEPGQYAQVNAGVGSPAVTYFWDYDDGWVAGGSTFDPTTSLIGDITATNTAIADNDTVTVAFGKAQGQIDERVIKQDFTSLTPGGTVTWACASRQLPLAKLTTTGSFTLDMTSVKSGSEGVLKVTANLAGSFIVTFDADFTNKDLYGTALPAYSFASGISGREYFLSYICDGTTLYWNIVDVVTLLTGDITSNSSGVTTIGANKVLLSMLATLANNKVIGNISGSTATPSALDVQEALVSDTTIQTTLNNNTGWIDDTKTGVTGLLAGQWYQGTSTNGKKYFYVCVTAGTAIRCLAGEGIEASTIPAINPFSAKTASYAVQLTDYTIEFTSVGDATLPSPASNAGQRFCIINNVAAGTTCNVIATINGTANFALTARYKYIMVMSTGSEYRNVGSN
jgi:hypothetical protein